MKESRIKKLSAVSGQQEKRAGEEANSSQPEKRAIRCLPSAVRFPLSAVRCPLSAREEGCPPEKSGRAKVLVGEQGRSVSRPNGDRAVFLAMLKSSLHLKAEVVPVISITFRIK